MITSLQRDIPESITRIISEFNNYPDNELSHHEIASLLKDSVLSGGKRLRFILTLLFGNLFGVPESKVITCAKAAEFIHAASLAHDDVIDSATKRRGRPSINVQSSNRKAVLAGDYLLANVVLSLSKIGNIDLLNEMSRTVQDMSLGEWQQLNSSEKRYYSNKIIEKIAFLKTGSLMGLCCVMPAILAKLSSDEIENCRMFGKQLGIGFQLLDDTLDFKARSQKNSLSDLKNGVVNSVLFEQMEKMPSLKRQYLDGHNIVKEVKKIDLSESILKVERRASKKFQKARQSLKSILKKIDIKDDQCAIIALKNIEEIVLFLSNKGCNKSTKKS